LLLVPAICIAFFVMYFINKSKINTPPYQFKQSVTLSIEQYINENPNYNDDYREDFYYHFNSETSISAFYNAIKNSTPMDYDTYLAQYRHDRETYESIVFTLPCIEEKFSYFPRYLYYSKEGFWLRLKENDNEKLYEIIMKLKSS